MNHEPCYCLFYFLVYNSDLRNCEQVGMLFVRCRGGVSHSPEEHVLDDDVWASSLAILAFIETQL